MEGYDVAQICPNGHVINQFTANCSESSTKHCANCGEATMTTCPACQASIRGGYWGSMSTAE